MNVSEQQIEVVLRAAPSPKVPAGLRARLVPGAAGGVTGAVEPEQRRGVGGGDARSRWWWILLPGLATAALAVALVRQEVEIRDLGRELAQLTEGVRRAAVAGPEAVAAAGGGALADGSARADLERLRAMVTALHGEVAGLAAEEAELARLLAALREAEARLPQEQREAMAVPERAASIRCVNHMKQLGLAVRVWANDNGDEFPPSVLSMTNELGTAVVLVCPADEFRTPAGDWASFTSAHQTYEFLTAGPGKFEDQPTRVLFRCPVHGHVTLCDGSVQMGLAKTQPERFETRDGGLFLKDGPNPTAPPRSPEGSEAVATAPPVGMAAQYGIGAAPGAERGVPIPLPLIVGPGVGAPADLGPAMDLGEAARQGLRTVWTTNADGSQTLIGTVPKGEAP